MSEEQPSLQIDADWKKQAQEEKRRLAEQQRAQQEKAAAAPPAPGLLTPGSGPAALANEPAPSATGRAPSAAARGRREAPEPSFTSLVNTLMTQALLYLGQVPTQAGPLLDLDRARYQIDLLTVLDEKTGTNLNEEERLGLDSALYELRMRFVQVASEFL